ncbi:MAG: phosphotransferase [Acidobacteriaceae bacterium]|nr:phosphotransferase [Acidobacteriaceae bacterium]MBV9499797.1 phosphotransferase [Acidobacteriaceae bacterium]
MISQEKNAAVTRGLREAFGVTTFEDIRDLTISPTSDLVFRIVVQGSPFLLRIIKRVADPTCHFTCMKAAAEGGLAPHVWYTSAEDRLSITDFVEAVPFPVAEALIRVPKALQALNALPPFPTRANHLNTSCTFLLNKGPALDGFIQRFQAANVLPRAESEELLARYTQVADLYSRHDADMVSSHNDLFKPDNILFDGHRAWLVDWEAAFLNDRYADLAVVANLVVNSDAEEKVYLQEYFGQPPDEYQQARFFLMQQVSHIFYAMAFLLLGSSGKPVNEGRSAPEFREFHRRIWAGEVNLRDNDTKTIYGRVHLEQLLQNVRQARFDEALRIVSDRYARS